MLKAMKWGCISLVALIVLTMMVMVILSPEPTAKPIKVKPTAVQSQPQSDAPASEEVIDRDYILDLMQDGSESAVRELYGLVNVSTDLDQAFCESYLSLGLSELADFASQMSNASSFANNCVNG